MFCPMCGADVVAEAIFCHKCGHRLEEQEWQND
ncbi:MAG: zinc-ribbon domain-containing protein, partial [Thermoguttaceae bacterium]